MNAWEKKHGASRRRIDKKLIAECERRIAAEERPIPGAINPLPPINLNDAERNRISRAFGRPPA